MSQAIKESHNKPEVREKISKSLKIHYSDENNLKKARDRMNEVNKRSDVREKRSRGLKKKWKNPTDRMLHPLLETGKRRGRRGATKSSIFSPYENKEITFDSNWERSYFLECLKNPGIVSVIRCPFSIQYINPNDSLIHNYIPDFLVEYRDGSKILVEIKPKYTKYDEVVISKSKSAMRYCKDIGIRFITLTENEL